MSQKPGTFGRLLLWLTTTTWVQVCLASSAWARAGGAGGSGGGGGGGGGAGGDGGTGFEGFGELLFMLFEEPAVLVLVLIILAFIGLYYLYQYPLTPSSPRGSSPEGSKETPHCVLALGVIDALKSDVAKLYVEVQQAWSNGDIKPVRQWLTDGVYQHLQRQLQMMAQIKSTNTLSDIAAPTVRFVSAQESGRYTAVLLQVTASLGDRLDCGVLPEFGYEVKETFTEYWSFIRASGASGAAGIRHDSCPSCAAPLPHDRGTVWRCEACGSLLNTGRYNWVLAGISQSGFQGRTQGSSYYNGGIDEQIARLQKEDPDFLPLRIEDHAANVFMQMEWARTSRNPDVLSRFTDPDFLPTLLHTLEQSHCHYYRLYLDGVHLLELNATPTQEIEAAVYLVYSSLRLNRSDGVWKKEDAGIIRRRMVLLFRRRAGTISPERSLYALVCPSCGAPMGETVDAVCAYCGASFVTGEHDWRFAGILQEQEIAPYQKAISSQNRIFPLPPSLFEDLGSVSGIAFRNMLAVMACDGPLNDEELRTMEALAARWHVGAAQLKDDRWKAVRGLLPVTFPVRPHLRRRVAALMREAAMADGVISPEEQAFLTRVLRLHKMIPPPIPQRVSVPGGEPGAPSQPPSPAGKP